MNQQSIDVATEIRSVLGDVVKGVLVHTKGEQNGIKLVTVNGDVISFMAGHVHRTESPMGAEAIVEVSVERLVTTSAVIGGL